MIRTFSILLIIAAFLAGTIFPSSATAPIAYAATKSSSKDSIKSTNNNYERLFYYAPSDLARASFFKNADEIDVFAPQTYKIDAEGNLTGFVAEDLLKFAKKEKIKVMPLVTNGSFSREATKAFLGDTKKEDKAIKSMVKEAKKHGYWGWQFDFEQMDASDRDLYTAFVKRTYKAMQKEKLMLSVAVIAQVSDNPKDYKAGLWDRVIGVYDYEALPKYVDFVSVMSYDDPESKGPIAQWEWLDRVLKWSMANIPEEKLSLGIGTYYWQWENATGKRVGIGGNEGVQNVFSKYAPFYYYDPIQKAPALIYFSTLSRKSYTLWYEDGRSVKDKLELVQKNNLRGLSFWALGLEDPTVFDAIKR